MSHVTARRRHLVVARAGRGEPEGGGGGSGLAPGGDRPRGRVGAARGRSHPVVPSGTKHRTHCPVITALAAMEGVKTRIYKKWTCKTKHLWKRDIKSQEFMKK